MLRIRIGGQLYKQLSAKPLFVLKRQEAPTTGATVEEEENLQLILKLWHGYADMWKEVPEKH